ncbi:MAG: formate dehydrogenase subunit gamma [Chitinophagales bacterium]
MEFLQKYDPNVKRVERFSYSARFAHWGHTVTFLLLLFTGMLLFMDSRWDFSAIFFGYRGAGLVHRIMAVGYTIIPIVCLIANFKGFVEWWKDVFGFGMNDIKFQMVFPFEFLGFKVHFPGQTKFNGGEKMNSVITTGSCVMIALSGYIMWFPQIFPAGLVRLAFPTHDIFVVMATMMVCMHGYLGSFHPGSGESLWGMIKGTVRADWAEHHHKAWYDSVTAEKE